VVVPADLPGTGAATGAGRAMGAAEDGADQQEQENVTSIADFIAARYGKSPIAGGGGGADLPGRRAALCRPATQRHRARGEPADRRRRRRHGHPRAGHGTDRVAGAGAVHHRVRYAQPRCHRAPPRHGAGDCV